MSWAQDRLKIAEFEWGPHPSGWPRPPLSRPRWWQFRRRRQFRAIEDVFGYLSDRALGRFWSEHRKGQGVYEDAGGYLLRCYAAMAGAVVEEPVTYSDVLYLFPPPDFETDGRLW